MTDGTSGNQLRARTEITAAQTKQRLRGPKPAAASWRDVLPIHPAAELFPPMAPAELRALGEDIKKNRLREPVTVLLPDRSQPPWQGAALLDGRNRLDAMEMVGIQLVGEDGHVSSCLHVSFRFSDDTDAYTYVISANLHRRHLTIKKKRELIANLIKADPSKSDRQIAEMVGVSPTSVGKVRAKMEAAGDVSKLDTRTDSKGRKQPTKKRRSKPKPEPKPEPEPEPKPEPSETDYEDWNAGEISRDEAEGRGIDTRPAKPTRSPPPAPNPLPSNSGVPAFDLAIKYLRRLQGESPTCFAQTYHSASDLEGVETFIRDVIKAKTTAPASVSGTTEAAIETAPSPALAPPSAPFSEPRAKWVKPKGLELLAHKPKERKPPSSPAKPRTPRAPRQKRPG